MKTEIYHCCKLQLHCKVKKIIFDNFILHYKLQYQCLCSFSFKILNPQTFQNLNILLTFQTPELLFWRNTNKKLQTSVDKKC